MHTFKNNIGLARFIYLILTIISLVAVSCTGRKNKIDTKNLIPEKDLISVLTDIYITNGLLTLPDIKSFYVAEDSSSAYKDVIEKHGYTKETMDKTMKYYFLKKPKQLIKIYDKVLARLSEMESRYEKEVLLQQIKASNLWPGKDSYIFPDPSGRDSTGFEFNVGLSGKYILSYSLTLFPDDQSFNPRLTLFTCNPDSADTGKKHYLNTIGYLKDGQPHQYSISISAPDKSYFHIGGKLYDCDNYDSDGFDKHAKIEKITVTAITGQQ